MNHTAYTPMRLLVPALLLLLCTLSAPGAQASDNRDILWTIVSNCLNTSVEDYCSSCRWPRSDSSCPQRTGCKTSTQVWAESDAFVALRDPKMCGCPDGFIHGLALPRSRVTGVEDPLRPAGIWKFAWDSAIGRISDSSMLALVVNPAGNRGQDQLHVHMLRMTDDAMQRISRRTVITVKSLDDVWNAAAQSAENQGLKDYGVLVIHRSEGGFAVLVEKENPEKKYTAFSCR